MQQEPAPALGQRTRRRHARLRAPRVRLRARGRGRELATLLDQGLPPNLRNERGDSLLMLACYHGHHDAAKVLLAHGADPEIMNDAGQAPLHGAAFKGDLQVATLLLDHGAQARDRRPERQDGADVRGHVQPRRHRRLLLARGADPFRLDADGNSMLDAARKMGALDTMELLAATLTQR
jgi:ankyrin repeat protein